MAVDNHRSGTHYVVRAINCDANPIYYDAEHAKESEAGTVIAPPTLFKPAFNSIPITFCGQKSAKSGLDLPRGQLASQKEGSSGGSGGGPRTLNSITSTTSPQSGDVLTATTKPGNSWEKEGRRGGKLMFSESVTEYRDESGDLVVTATVALCSHRTTGNDQLRGRRLMTLRASELQVRHVQRGSLPKSFSNSNCSICGSLWGL